MGINVSVQYNDEFIPEIILLTLCDNIGEPFQRGPLPNRKPHLHDFFLLRFVKWALSYTYRQLRP